MQNTMLNSTISSNSQELFDFNAEHNGEACIESLRPEDSGFLFCGADSRPPFPLVLYPSLSRGHEVKRPQKLFLKKSCTTP